MHGLSLAQSEYLVAARLSWMRLCRLWLGDAVPDSNTLWDFREALIATGALETLFTRLDAAITGAGYLDGIGQVSRIHCRKPRGRPLPKHHARANVAKSAVRAPMSSIQTLFEAPMSGIPGVSTFVVYRSNKYARRIDMARGMCMLGAHIMTESNHAKHFTLLFRRNG